MARGCPPLPAFPPKSSTASETAFLTLRGLGKVVAALSKFISISFSSVSDTGIGDAVLFKYGDGIFYVLVDEQGISAAPGRGADISFYFTGIPS